MCKIDYKLTTRSYLVRGSRHPTRDPHSATQLREDELALLFNCPDQFTYSTYTTRKHLTQHPRLYHSDKFLSVVKSAYVELTLH